MTTNWKLWAPAAGVFALTLAFAPDAVASCGPGAPLARPAGLQMQTEHGRLVLASDDSAPIVGMWHVKFTAEGNGSALPDGTPVDDALIVWHSDNTEVMNSKRPAQDGDFCLGVWEQVGKSTYKLNHFAWFANGYDPTNPASASEIGPPVGPTQFAETVTLSPDGNHYSGRFTLDAYDTSGNVMTHLTGVISATRITLSTKVPDLL